MSVLCLFIVKNIPKNVPNFLCGSFSSSIEGPVSAYPLYSLLMRISCSVVRPFQPRLSNFILQTAPPVLLELSVFLASCVHVADLSLVSMR